MDTIQRTLGQIESLLSAEPLDTSKLHALLGTLLSKLPSVTPVHDSDLEYLDEKGVLLWNTSTILRARSKGQQIDPSLIASCACQS